MDLIMWPLELYNLNVALEYIKIIMTNHHILKTSWSISTRLLSHTLTLKMMLLYFFILKRVMFLDSHLQPALESYITSDNDHYLVKVN